MTFGEYKNKVKSGLVKKYKYTSAEVDKFFGKDNISSALERNYKGYTAGIAGCGIDATVGCMDMMYDE